MKKKLKVLIVLFVAMMILVGCSSQDNSSDGQDSTEYEHFVGFSANTFSDNWMVTTSEELEELCRNAGYRYTALGAEGVAATQVSQIENMVTMGCDYLVVSPVDPDALHDVLKDASSKGVKIVMTGHQYDDDEPFAISVSGDQREFGASAAKAAAAWIDETFPDAEDGSVEVALFINSTYETFVERADGMADIEKLTSKAKIVETYDLIGQADANTKVQEYTDQLLMSHPNIKVIISHSSDYGNAIDEVIMRTAGLDTDNMGIFSCDWLEATADSLKASSEGKSVIRAFIDSGNYTKDLFNALTGELATDENGIAWINFYTWTVDNVDEAYAIH